MTQLSPRQQSIFFRVVDTHIDTAQPVGSKAITELFEGLYRESYSSATVRHEMGRLEELGHLTHPHTSAGRIPTDKGYRYYVDNSYYEERVSSDLFEELNEEDEDQLGESICQKLSALTRELAIVIMPAQASSRLKVVVRGSAHILEKPEFQNTQKAKMIFEVLEKPKLLSQILSGSVRKKGEASVSIGKENEEEAFKDCSIIVSMFSLRKNAPGMMAVVGPKRMHYLRTITMVSNATRIVNRFF